jgi:DNA ligase D-like protein (predicted polymerase)
VIERTNTAKVLWPDSGVTKGELLDHLEALGPRIVAEISGRPLTVVRAPSGIDKQVFFQKNAPAHTPPWIRTVTLAAPSARRDVRYYVCDTVEALLWLGNQAAVEFHVATARLPRLERSDLLAFDLDPPEERFELAVAAARMIDTMLRSDGLRPAIKTTGGKGLHVVVPVEPTYEPDALHSAAVTIATRALAERPDLFTLEFKKADRGGRLLIDIGRNAPGATLVAAYSPRARSGAPVSFPVTVDELDDVRPGGFTVRTARDLVGSAGVAAWEETMSRPQKLPASLTS